MGYCYDSGLGIKQDYKKAVFWYKKAAAQGDTVARFNLGNCYRTGRGVMQDEKKSTRLYRLAANDGYIPAIHNLGNCYYYGVGVRKNYKKRRSCSSPALKPTATPVLWQENVMNTAEA